MYTVFTTRRRIIFSYERCSMRADGYAQETLDTAEEVFSFRENGFEPEEKSAEEIYSMVAGGFAFFPISRGTRAGDIRSYIEAGFNVAFLRAGDFRRLRKDCMKFL